MVGRTDGILIIGPLIVLAKVHKQVKDIEIFTRSTQVEQPLDKRNAA